MTWEDETEGTVLPWTASETESVSFNVVAGSAMCEGSVLVSVPENECADSAACNFNPEHICSSACVFPFIPGDCDAGAGACGPGTTWNVALQQCDVTMIGDTNFDGCIELMDLLDVLSGYGNCFD